MTRGGGEPACARRGGGTPGARRRPGERGSASVLVLALCTVLALLGATAVALGGAAVARHRAASAADLAALAAADRATSPGAACSAAARAARAVGAHLQRCDLDRLTAEVVVAVRPGGWLGRLGAATARARAGPGGASVPGPGL